LLNFQDVEKSKSFEEGSLAKSNVPHSKRIL